MKLATTLIGLTLSLFASASVEAQCADESRIRTATSNLSASSFGSGTATGLGTSRIILKDCFGRVIANRTVAQWCTNQNLNGVRVVESVVAHSGGQTSIRFSYANVCATNPLFIGGSVTVCLANGCVVDVDPVY